MLLYERQQAVHHTCKLDMVMEMEFERSQAILLHALQYNRIADICLHRLLLAFIILIA